LPSSRTGDSDVEHRVGPLFGECARRCGGGLDRTDPAGERHGSYGTCELSLGCGDDEDHPGNGNRVTPKGEPAQGSARDGISTGSRNTFAAARPQTAAMTTREPPTAGAALAFHSV